MKLNETNCPAVLAALGVQVFESEDGLVVMVSNDDTSKFGVLKHVSVSRVDKYPSWDEIIEVKNQIFGDVDAMMIMPKKEDYVNVHKFCFHVWECPTGWGIC